MYTERDSIGRMKLLFEAWHGDLGEKKGEERKNDREEGRKIRAKRG